MPLGLVRKFHSRPISTDLEGFTMIKAIINLLSGAAFSLATALLTPAWAADLSEISGDWKIVSRQCDSWPEPQLTDGAVMSFDLEAGRYTVDHPGVPAGLCEIHKVGELEAQPNGTVVFHIPTARATGACNEVSMNHVRLVNENYARGLKTDGRVLTLSDDGQTLEFSEQLDRDGFACNPGEALHYKMERAQ